jgi:hypothetical protein
MCYGCFVEDNGLQKVLENKLFFGYSGYLHVLDIFGYVLYSLHEYQCHIFSSSRNVSHI